MRPVIILFPVHRIALTAGILGVCQISGGVLAHADTVLPEFSMDIFAPGTEIDNPYFPLGEDYEATIHAEGVDEDGEEFE